MPSWDPQTYLTYVDERSRPFFELTARIGATAPRRVVDLGCGPGHLTTALAQRWSRAHVEGIDSSPAMIEEAEEHSSARLRFRLADLVRWRPDSPVDVLVSNAALQWVPGHRELLPSLLGELAGDGWFAFQVPGNFEEPSHVLLRELACDRRFAGAIGDVEMPVAGDAATYLSDLTHLGCRVDAWETTYLHVLRGPDPVFEWISGTGARPVLERLGGALLEAFVGEYKERLRVAYPQQHYGTVLPFRRVFVVAQRLS